MLTVSLHFVIPSAPTSVRLVFQRRPSRVATQAARLHRAPTKSGNRHNLRPKPARRMQEEHKAPGGPVRAEHFGSRASTAPHHTGVLSSAACPSPARGGKRGRGCPPRTDSLAVYTSSPRAESWECGPQPADLPTFQEKPGPEF